MSGSVGGVDASIPLQAGRGVAPPVNPLQALGQFAETKNLLNQNALFPGQMALQQQAVQGGQVGLAQKINQAGYQALAPILAMPQGAITHSAFTTALASIENNLGIPTSGILQDVMATSPTGDGPAFDQKIRSLVASRAQTSSEGAVAQVTPQGGPLLSTGQEAFPTTVAPAGLPGAGRLTAYGAPPGSPAGPGGGVPILPGNAQLIGQVMWTDASGTTHYGTQLEYDQARGIPGAMLSAATPVQQGQQGQQGAPTPGGVVGVAGPVGPQNPPRLGAPTDTAGPTPGTSEFSIASAGNANAANVRAASFATDMFPLMQAQTALAKAPTGKGSEVAHDVSSYLNTFAPAVLQKALSFISPIMTPDEVSAYDEAKKYLTQGQLGQTGAARSDQGLTTAGAASPSTVISKEAAQLVLKGMIGLRRMEQEGTLEFNNSGQPPAGFNQFMTQFATRADPRVYTFDQITPQQRQQLLQSLKTPAQRQAFETAVERAEQNGILTAPGATP